MPAPSPRLWFVPRRLGLALLAWLLAVPLAWAQPAAGQRAEYRIKAAYLYNFTRFVEWPPATFPAEATPFVIAVVDPEGTALSALREALQGKTTPAGRAIEVRAAEDFAAALGHGQIIFIPGQGDFDPVTLRTPSRHPGVLVVGERDGFAEAGGTINLVSGGGSVRCEINLAAAERAGLKLSGRLASVSRLVRETPAR